MIEATVKQCFPFVAPVFCSIVAEQLNNRNEEKKPDTLAALALKSLINARKQDDPYSVAYHKLLCNEPYTEYEALREHPVMLTVLKYIIPQNWNEIIEISASTTDCEFRVRSFVVAKFPAPEDFTHWPVIFGHLALSKNCRTVKFLLEYPLYYSSPVCELFRIVCNLRLTPPEDWDQLPKEKKKTTYMYASFLSHRTNPINYVFQWAHVPTDHEFYRGSYGYFVE